MIPAHPIPVRVFTFEVVSYFRGGYPFPFPAIQFLLRVPASEPPVFDVKVSGDRFQVGGLGGTVDRIVVGLASVPAGDDDPNLSVIALKAVT
jgi:hypothetical protein